MTPDMESMLASLADGNVGKLSQWSRSARNVIRALEKRGYVEYTEGGTAVAVTEAGRLAANQ